MKKLYSIGETAKMLGVSVDTIRRWDEKNIITSLRVTEGGHRYYTKDEIDKVLLLHGLDVYSIAYNWVTSEENYIPEQTFLYCPDSSVFQARLGKLSTKISDINNLKDEYPLITAIVGEIGNNAFDHNIGAWPEIRGIIFGYDLHKRYIVIADKGRGIFNTLKYVKPNLNNHEEALNVAFTETISARKDQKRGNGLKFVRDVVTEIADTINIKLTFITGDAVLNLTKGDTDITSKINKYNKTINGCFVHIEF